MIRRAVYKEIGGFDPAFRVDFGDIDLCLKARQLGIVLYLRHTQNSSTTSPRHAAMQMRQKNRNNYCRKQRASSQNGGIILEKAIRSLIQT